MEESSRTKKVLLLASVFGVAMAGLVYELIAGTLTTYLLGGSVLVFSLVIGWFLFAMGAGAWLAQFVKDGDEGTAFVQAELLVAVSGGLSALTLFAVFCWSHENYLLVLTLVTGVIGAGVGVEIPLLLRILKRHVELNIAVSQVLAIDYIGALAGSILFPIVLLPYLGVVRAAALFGLLNIGVAVLGVWVLWEEVKRRRLLLGLAAGSAVLLLTVFVTGMSTTRWLEDELYEDNVLLAVDTSYSRMVVTRYKKDVRLYLSGHLQFSTSDEYRYHEALVYPAMSAVPHARRVLLLGGGDGLAAARILEYAGVEQIDIVDLDDRVTDLFTEHPMLSRLNSGSLRDPRVNVFNEDAVAFLQTAGQYDVIIADLPDPNDDQLSRLYALSTYRLLLSRLTPAGVMVTQATSPYFAPEAFWCIVTTLEKAVSQKQAKRAVYPAHVQVPSFGEWGFVLVGPQGLQPRTLPMPSEVRYLNAEALAAMWAFPADMSRVPVEVNRLSEAKLAGYYRNGWGLWRN